MTETIDYVYRLAGRDEWARAEASGEIPKRDVDIKDGYFHLSTRAQLIETANIHFAGASDLLALEIPVADIAEALKFELAPSRGEAFPHYYGPLKRSHVRAAFQLDLGEDGFVFGAGL